MAVLQSALCEKALNSYQDIDGMLPELAAMAVTSVFEYQQENDIGGDLAEFGVYKGRCAALLATYVRPNESLHLVDISSFIETEKIDAINKNYTFHKISSNDFIEKVLHNQPSQSFRFIHADGSHTFDNVMNDIKVADQLLSDDGVVVFDDYQNPNYPQVPAAVFTYLAESDSDLRMFMLGANKAYFCRSKKHTEMLEFAMRQFPAMVDDFGISIVLSKTDNNEHLDAVSFYRRAQGKDAVFSRHLYGKYFEGYPV